ncbi:hypothetical protein, partial [Photorhabdus sp. RM96S]|uniref:hypothetical protein n=1 Tax=Photorhabdus sp. RM96S TaxID=3342822 RepID=UPI0036D87C28
MHTLALIRLLTKCWFFIRHFVLIKFRSLNGACHHVKTPPLQTFPPETLSLDELVPKNHLVRQVDAAIDFEFIR